MQQKTTWTADQPDRCEQRLPRIFGLRWASEGDLKDRIAANIKSLRNQAVQVSYAVWYSRTTGAVAARRYHASRP